MAKNYKGVVLAAAVAGLFLAGKVMAADTAPAAGGGNAAMVKCKGVNACKGKSACKGENACKGQNGCKGKGWMDMSEADCKAKGGTVVK